MVGTVNEDESGAGRAAESRLIHAGQAIRARKTEMALTIFECPLTAGNPAQLGRDVKVSVSEYLPALAVPDVSGDSGRFVGGERLSVDDFVYFY